MRAALLNENSAQLVIAEVEEPKISRGEALVRVEATGLCRTDLHIVHGVLRPPTYPHILGHEISGKVVDASPSSPTDEGVLSSLEKTKSNALLYHCVFCGYCRYCRVGKTNLCVNLRRLGFELPGGFAEYVKAPIRNLVPSALGPEYAVLPDAGATVVHAFKKLSLRPGAVVAIAGIGGLGSIAIQLAKRLGCRVVAIDVVPEKISLAGELGADLVVNMSESSVDELSAVVFSLTEGSMVDVFVDLVGNTMSQQMAIATLGRDSRIVQLAYGDSRYENLRLKDVVYNEVQIIGSLASTLTDLYEAVQLASSGYIRPIVSNVFTLEEINTALSELEGQRILGRCIIVP